MEKKGWKDLKWEKLKYDKKIVEFDEMDEKL